ncbi:RNA chaperone Hfq [Lawsonibacter faecis]|nr:MULTISPECIES: RNA chaperone Hfq [Oscillospiraceae]
MTGSPPGFSRAGKQQMIYKHAISTIVPEQPIVLNEAE